MINLIGSVFEEEDLNCNCGCGYFVVNTHLISCMEQLLHELNQEYDSPVTIHICSWCRCPVHNKAVGGAPLSQHTKGAAVDIKASYYKHGEVVYIPGDDLLLFGSRIFDRGYHIDWGSRKACHFDVKYHPKKKPFEIIRV